MPSSRAVGSEWCSLVDDLEVDVDGEHEESLYAAGDEPGHGFAR